MLRFLSVIVVFAVALVGSPHSSTDTHNDEAAGGITLIIGSETLELNGSPRVEPMLNPIVIGLCNAGFGETIISEWENPIDTFALRCGDDKSGYVHIREGHQSSWQGIIDKYGLVGTVWDDVMEFATGGAIIGPEYGYPINVGNGKSCYPTPVIVVDDAEVVIGEFYVTVIVSDTKKRVITSYPSGNAPAC